MNQTANAIQQALNMFEKFESIVRILDPSLDDEQVYQATKRLMNLALNVQLENDTTQ